MIRALLWMLALSVLSRETQAARRVVVLTDTSASMRDNDSARYTVQIARIIGDLLSDADHFGVVRMPDGERTGGCTARPDPAILSALDPAQRAAFKAQIDDFLVYDSGTVFLTPMATALDYLGTDVQDQRLLLIVADSGGFDAGCRTALLKRLAAFRQSGAMVASISLEGNSSDFTDPSAFTSSGSANTPEEMLARIADVYQRFLGARSVQSGPVNGIVEVEIHPHVSQAFLVVAAEGTLSPPQARAGNPGAASIESDYRGGGTTPGLDGTPRSYRIVRLERPAAGTWRFEVPGLSGRAGWLLIEDFALTPRLLSPTRIGLGSPATVQVQVVDASSGAPLASEEGLEVEATVDGEALTLRDDGQGVDERAGDGVFSGEFTPGKAGEIQGEVVARTPYSQSQAPIRLDVVELSWTLDARLPARLEAGEPVQISAKILPVDPGGRPARAPDRVKVEGDADLELLDDGNHGDGAAGDSVYGGIWTPSTPGAASLVIRAAPEDMVKELNLRTEVVGVLDLGSPPPIAVGALEAHQSGQGVLDLSEARVIGPHEVLVHSTLDRAAVRVEMQQEQGWIPLEAGAKLALSEGGRRAWPVRVTVGGCPGEVRADEQVMVRLSWLDGQGGQRTLDVPVVLAVQPQSLLACWWWLIALIGGAILLAVLVYGWIWPAAFPPRLGVWISPEADLSEGFFHPIRAVSGTRIGFYRHARVYVHPDWRLSGRASGALARVRADRAGVVISAMGGQVVQRFREDTGWEEIPRDESPMRFGTTYRNDAGNCYFELRTRA